MKMNVKSPLFLISFGVILFAGLMNFSFVLGFVNQVIRLIFPILLGMLFAFVLNVPMRGFESLLKRAFAGNKRKPEKRTIQAFSLLLTLVCILLVITIACTMAIPALVSSVKSIIPLIEKKWPEWLAILNSYEIDVTMLNEWVSGLDIKQLTSNAGNIWSTAVSAASSTISGITNLIFGIVISIYTLLSKSRLAVQAKKLTYANFSKATADYLCYMGTLARDTYTKFLSGQCMEAIILGTLIAVAFSLFRLPYAGLIGFLTSLFAFVPYVGAFASCAIGVFLTLLVDPSRVLICIAVYMVVQFIENQFIYPHVVGSSVGLAPLWTLIAALIGGKLFGIVGIVFFIPLAAVLYILIREDTNRKLNAKGCAAIETPESHGGTT